MSGPRGVDGACDRAREALSAELDGESGPDERAWVASHLDGCAACRRWQQRAATVTRLARTGTAEPGPDLVATAVAHAPARRRGPGGAGTARVALAVIGLAQLALGLVALLGAAVHAAHGTHAPTGAVLGAGMAHVAHESAAWNLALGAAFLFGALRPRHLAGLLPVLGVFIGLLAVLSVIDLAGGRVDGGRVVAHLLLVAGFTLGLVVVRAGPYPGRGPAPGGRGREGRAGVAGGGRVRPDGSGTSSSHPEPAPDVA